ncbi:MAG TPA: neuraminidase-like domain-containing protein, partial [Candidatus Nanopelagicales bacterium]|nr:neuraminidase-like domain-containing protein [Candidatus Nanopelagicales bacterium]
VARPLRDVLRERHRAALVDYLAWKRGYTDTKQLFDDLLVDVEMSPCQLTSRIKQAIGTVQLFVQRCFLNLEPGVALGDEAAREWKWMKSYRVWEANRKVFLYPENWIEPELRDDKTPFFTALENQLLQGDLDHDSAEEAFRGYLEKLDQVARLEVMGMVHEKEAAGSKAVDILHVFARTRAEPRVHFYRRRLGDGAWTPWEKLDLDIQSEHLIPVIFERRLLLLWAILEEKPEDDQSGNMGDPSTPGQPASTLLEIKLAWSERKHGKWTARRVAETTPLRVSSILGTQVLTQLLYFRVYPRAMPFSTEGPSLVVRCLQRVDTGLTLTKAKSRRVGDFVLSGCRGRWRMTSHQGSTSFKHRQPGYAQQDRMAIVSPWWQSTAGLHLLAGKLTPGPQKQLADSGELLEVLKKSAGQFRILLPNAYEDFLDQDAFIYEDDNRSFFVTPTTETTIEWTQASRASIDIIAPVWAGAGISSLAAPLVEGSTGDTGDGRPLEPMVGDVSWEVIAWASSAPEIIFIPHIHVHHRWRFEPFYHPYACGFIRHLNRHGVEGLLDWSTQSPRLQLAIQDRFAQAYQPTDAVALPHPVEDVDFSPGGAYSAYNWELFFHAPLLIADRLSKNLRFEEAQRWFHAIFDPTTGSTDPIPQRFWKVRPFYENTDLAAIDELLAGQDSALSGQIEAWRRNPFNPHLIARLRPLAYQKTVVMKYIDNLIGWADQLFRRDTIESINEATQLYILAAEILGPRPRAIPPRAAAAPKTYRELEPLLDDFSNALVQIESWAPSGTLGSGLGSDEAIEPLVIPSVLYFCIPPNDKLLGYWDTVADRLFKIRHCMNIEGVVRQLPLFEPPIDPALLVRAAAAGVDLSTVIQDITAPEPHHRFQVLLQKANELCAEVKALGQALLSALEKRDAEALARLRSNHEVQLLDAVRRVKAQQVTEAQESLAALRKTREMASLRHEFYRDVPFLNSAEIAHLTMSGAAAVGQAVIEGIMAGAAASYPIPATTVGAAGWAASAVAINTPVDGARIGAGVEAGAKAASIAVSLMREAAAVSATMGGYRRRWDEWKREEKVAARELEQLDRQIAAAEVRLAIAEKELENHDLQAEQAREAEDFLRDKFTSQDLYDWTCAQTSAIYFQAYQLAYAMAKRAERAYRFERDAGSSSSSYIQFGHWDSLRKGLLAGDRLSLDLRRLELAYMEQDRRELELTKNISLLLHDPAALMTLKATGTCTVSLPEALFDMDFPGHYMRRIKSVSLTLPCVVGPYDSVNCTLTLETSQVRAEANLSAALLEGHTPVRSVATSHGQADSGMFEVNFRDERYLPFEGAGAISTWRLELPLEDQAFDVESLSDVVMHLRYTARYGGDTLKEAARTARNAWLEAAASEPLARMFSLRQEFAAPWQAFVESSGTATLALELGAERFPFQLRGRDIQIHRVELYARPKPDAQAISSLSLAPPGGQADPVVLTPLITGGDLLRWAKDYQMEQPLGSWALSAQAADTAALEDIVLIWHYTATLIQGGTP